MNKEVYIFGTCRICYLDNTKIIFKKILRKCHSRFYQIENKYNIYTEPVNYTTKLSDIYDSILYLNNKLYNEKNVNLEILKSIFFRGHLDIILPNTHPLEINKKIKFDKVILEIFSIKEYIINTKKFGDIFFGKKLPWKIKTNYEHDIKFNKKDFICKILNEKECFDILEKIFNLVNCQILIIGPYFSKKVPNFVNEERMKTQNILKKFCNNNNNFQYFDMSLFIKNNLVIEKDAHHFDNEGNKIISNKIYEFIIN